MGRKVLERGLVQSMVAQGGVVGWRAVMTGAWSQPLYRVPPVWGHWLWVAVLGQDCRGAFAWLEVGPHSCGGATLVGAWLE